MSQNWHCIKMEVEYNLPLLLLSWRANSNILLRTFLTNVFDAYEIKDIPNTWSNGPGTPMNITVGSLNEI